MNNNLEIYDFILNNIRKLIKAEELVNIDASVSRLELLGLLLTQRQPNIMMSDLAVEMTIPMSTATGIVNRLVKKGLLARGSHAEDRRVVTVTLTDDGKILVEKANNLFNTLIDRVRDIVTEEEFAFIFTILQKIIFELQKTESPSDNKKASTRQNISID